MYDVAIIGAGAAGIACAKSTLTKGLKTVLIETSLNSFGGTCLNKGCIPTKFFLNSLKLHKAWADCAAESQQIIEAIKSPSVLFLEKNGVDIVWGQAHFLTKNALSADGKTISAKSIIIATGSSNKTVLTDSRISFAEDIFARAALGKRILIIGAGYVGVEMASLLHAFGCNVHLIEIEKQILSSFSSHLAMRLKILLEKRGIKIEVSKSLSECNLDNFDMIVSCAGRIPQTAGLNLEGVGIECDLYGWIKTDKYMRTNVKNIYACGDVTGKKLLAYMAEYQGRLCIMNIKKPLVREEYEGVPECVFSIPCAAKVGLLQEEAKEAKIEHRVIKSNFLRFSSAYVYGDTDGFIEIVVDKKERIIGAAIISSQAAELISILSLCVKNNLKLADLKKCIFIHPTLSEIIPTVLN